MVRISKAKFRNALKGSLGIITTIAKRCDCNRISIYRLIENNPELKKEIEAEKDKVLDVAESGLFSKVNSGDWKAIQYMLDRKGNKRGYTPKQDIEQTGIQEIKIKFDEPTNKKQDE